MAKEITLKIDKFLGIRNDGSGETNLKKGELSQMQNFKIAEGYKAVKRRGYTQVLQEAFATPIDGVWYGKIKGNFYLVVATDGKFYIVNEDGTTTLIGTMRKGKANFFTFNDALYVQNGTDYKKFTAETEEVPVSDKLFESTSYAGTYPTTVTATKDGYYTVTLKGGKGTNDGQAQGGKGGTVRFRMPLSENDVLEISKVDGSGKGVKLKKNGTTIAVVGGGGQAAVGFYFEPGADETYYYKGGDGGSSVGENGTTTLGDTTAGKGANGSTGGEVGGKNAPDGSGGTAPNGTTGGGGYAGGGGGTSSYTNPYLQGAASAGGGSSYLINTLTAIENSRGTNDGAEYALVTMTEELYYGFVDVAGYVPIVAVSTKPDGSSATMYEGINALTGKKRMRFNGNSSSATFQLLEKGVTSIDSVKVGGVVKTVNTHYAVNLTNGTVTFTEGNIPPTGIDNVEIQWTKSASDRSEVAQYTNAKLYGGKNDNRVFLYGVGNRLIFSGLADGIPSAEYFPVLNYMDVGSTQYDIMDLSVQYDRMIIHKEKGSWWTQYSFDESLGVSFPVYPLNDAIGSTVKGQSQIVLNNPHVVFGNQIYQFVASNVRDERNVKTVSDRVQPLLNELDLSDCITFDNESDGEYWIIIQNRVYILNYKLDVWYYYFLADTVKAIIKTDLGLLFGTETGQLMRFDDSLTDNGELINAFMETGWLDYGYPNIRKFLNFMWVQILPEGNTSADIYYQIDRWIPIEMEGVLYNVLKIPKLSGQETYTNVDLAKQMDYDNMDFGNVNFADFSFITNYNPKSFRLKPKAKKFVYIKFTFANNEDTSLTILGFKAPVLLGGRSK